MNSLIRIMKIKKKLNWTSVSRNLCNQVFKSPRPDVSRPEMPLHHLVWKNLSKWPNHVAIECAESGKKYSYSQLYLRIKRLKTSLHRIGMDKGATVGICLQNSPDFPISFFGCLEAGLIVSFMNPQSTQYELIKQVEATDVNCIFCQPSNLKIIKDIRNHLKKDIKIICTDGLNNDSPSTDGGVILFEDLIKDSITELNSKDMEVDWNETAIIPFSSGTSGQPKGVCLTHTNLAVSAQQIFELGKWIESQGSHQDTLPIVLPFFHSYGRSIMIASLTVGAKIISFPKLNINGMIDAISKSKNVFMFAVPSLLSMMGNSEFANEKTFSTTREIVTAAEPFKRQQIENIKRKTKALISQVYGMTEMTAIISWSDNLGPQSSSGFLLGGTTGQIVKIDTGNVRSDETGEICIKGLQMMKGYLNNPAATSEVIDKNGWLHTGDLGHIDKQGNLYITGRIKELIKVHGYPVSPTELEEIILQVPGVKETAVVGAPTSTGETPAAFVVSEPGAKITETDVMQHVNNLVFKHKRVSSVKFVESLPKSSLGKLSRKELNHLL